MRKEPFPIKNILDSLREDVQNGTITLSQAADELHRAGWSNYIDEDTARRLLNLQARKADANAPPVQARPRSHQGGGAHGPKPKSKTGRFLPCRNPKSMPQS